MKAVLRIVTVLSAFAVGTIAGTRMPVATASDDTQPAQVYELRVYTAAEGKYEDLLTRFRDHTLGMFESHGMTNVGYWTPQDAPMSDNLLIYLLAHPSRDAAEENWQSFIADPEWQAVFEASRADGPLIVGLERTWLDPTDFSPLR